MIIYSRLRGVMFMRAVGSVFALCCILVSALPSLAGEEPAESLVSTAVVGLRGGFDSSPTDRKSVV